jgi:hypothetical protein
LPSWNKLIQKLLFRLLEKNTNSNNNQANTISKLFPNVFKLNPLIIARYLKLGLEKRPEFKFESAVHDILYEEFDNSFTSAAIKELSHLCLSVYKNPKIDSVITYNFDDILERQLDKIDSGFRYKSIYDSEAVYEETDFKIYHVHGYIPFDRPTEKVKFDPIVLSEEKYHEQYNDHYSFSNVIQINKFAYNSCLFIGLSFTDPNMRRLLEVSKALRSSKEIKHFAVRPRYKNENIQKEIEFVLKQDPSIEIEKISSGLKMTETVEIIKQLIEMFEENDAKSFGIGTIWINDFDEIPCILKQLRV